MVHNWVARYVHVLRCSVTSLNKGHKYDLDVRFLLSSWMKNLWPYVLIKRLLESLCSQTIDERVNTWIEEHKRINPVQHGHILTRSLFVSPSPNMNKHELWLVNRSHKTDTPKSTCSFLPSDAYGMNSSRSQRLRCASGLWSFLPVWKYNKR